MREERKDDSTKTMTVMEQLMCSLVDDNTGQLLRYLEQL